MIGWRSGKTFFWEQTEIIKNQAKDFADKAVKADFEVIEEKPEPQEIKLLNP